MNVWPALPDGTTADWVDGDLDRFASAFADVAALAGCPQHDQFHAEGDVAVHTALVVDALRRDPAFVAADVDVRRELTVAAVLHDIGKPVVTRRDDSGIWRAPGHAHAGAVRARGLLWRAGVPADARERICVLIDSHLRPFHLLERPASHARAVTAAVSLTAGCDRLAVLATADAAGRIAPDRDRLVDTVAMFADWARELGCFATPYPFASERARVGLLADCDRDWSWDPWDDTRCEVTVMVGFPGSGKSRWVGEHCHGLPMVSLDRLSAELRVDPAGDQGAVVAAARREAVRLLGQATSFVWDATNVTRDRRRQIIDTAFAYHARVRIVAIECAEPVLRERNRARRRPVPDPVIDALIRRWEAPSIVEAHQVDVVDTTCA